MFDCSVQIMTSTKLIKMILSQLHVVIIEMQGGKCSGCGGFEKWNKVKMKYIEAKNYNLIFDEIEISFGPSKNTFGFTTNYIKSLWKFTSLVLQFCWIHFWHIFNKFLIKQLLLKPSKTKVAVIKCFFYWVNWEFPPGIIIFVLILTLLHNFFTFHHFA